jgi:hypothetical protein
MKLGNPPKTFENLDERWYYCYLCGGGHTAAADLLTNGDFTSATTGWTAGNSASLASSDSEGPFGNNCLTITEGGTNTPQAYQTVDVSAETGHKLCYWEKRGTEYQYRVRAYDATNGADILSTAWLDGSVDWMGHTVQFVTPASCVSLTVYLESHAMANDATTFQFDRVYLYGEHGSTGLMYPESMTILAKEDGHRYCLDHYTWRFRHKYIDEVEIDITDDLD